MTALGFTRRAAGSVWRPVRVFVTDVGHGFLEISHNSLALVGLVVVAALIFVAARSDLQALGEAKAFRWLQSRHAAKIDNKVDVPGLQGA